MGKHKSVHTIYPLKNNMHKLLIAYLVFFISCNNKEPEKKETPKTVVTDTVQAKKNVRASNSYTPVDVSPMDLSYYPVDYPKLHNPAGPPLARVLYSRPHLQGRKLFDQILKYGEPWRLGANEATEIEFFKPVTILGKKIQAGRYIIYCIPEKEKWSIVLNKNVDSWGLHRDPSQDVAKFEIPARTTEDSLEYFTMLFRDGANGNAELYMAWDNVEAALPISFK
jgi:hypothetical protein